MKFIPGLLVFGALSYFALAADVGFIPKPLPTDKSIGSTAIPQIKLGDKVLKNVPLLISNTGGLNLWIKDAKGNGSIQPIALTLEEKNGEKVASVKVAGKELSEKVPAEKQALKAMAWLLIQRYPKEAFTRAFLQKYFHVAHPATMTDEEKTALNRPRTTDVLGKSLGDHGLGAGGLPFKGRSTNTAGDAPTLEQLHAFYEHPEEWGMSPDGTCTDKGCTINHKPAKEGTSLGSMLASNGMKKLMVDDSDFADPAPAAPTKSSHAGGTGQHVRNQAEFEKDFKDAKTKENEAWVLFTADNCGPCQSIHNALAAGTKRVPAGVKLYVVSVPSYSWDTLSTDVQTFKGGKGFPQVIKFTKGAGGALSRTSMRSGDTSLFQ